ncbi:MAG: DUF4476 domain-containing protein [Ignavibacteria bacterium]|nr:DUF4476 domain-containing protein [Ignavibacteria bacterium]
MKSKIIAIAFLLSFISIAQEYNHGDRNKDPNDLTIRQLINKISSNFEKLEREYLTKLSYRDYIRAKSLLIESYELLNEIPMPEENQYLEPLPISNPDFAGLVESIKNESFEEDKIGVVSIASKYHFFLVDQVLQLIDLYPFSGSKIEVIKLTYPNVLDKNNSHRLISAFTFSSDKEEAKKIINTYPIK